jgi:hypothetical protein
VGPPREVPQARPHRVHVVTAFTSYPGLVYQDPRDIPADHYADAVAHARPDAPFALSEVGHFAGAIPGWASNADEQARFVAWLAGEIEARQPALVVWLHLHDQSFVDPLPFKTMGLIGGDGATRPAYDAWVNVTKA